MNIVLAFDQNPSTLPAGFVSAVNYVANYFDNLFTNNVTIRIGVGYGEVGNGQVGSQQLSPFAGGESEDAVNGVPGFLTENYSAVRAALQAQGAPGSSTLPVNSPFNTNNILMGQAQAKALGLVQDNGTIDGYVGFNSIYGTWDFNPGEKPPWTQFDFTGTVFHEISEVLGRTSMLAPGDWSSTMDLYRYSAPGVPQTTTGGPSYFSVDGGQTDLKDWNNFTSGNTAGDLGDWAFNGNDAANWSGEKGEIEPWSQVDTTLMNAIGWTPGHPLFGSTTHDVTSTGGNVYALYEAILGRAPDALGFEGDVNAINHGASLESIAQGMVNSPEFVPPWGDRPNSDFVNHIYQDALHRQADPAGLAAWDNALANGVSRADVAIDIGTSAEAHADMASVFSAGVFVPNPEAMDIARLYYGILNRAPDAGGLQNWTTAMNNGASITDVAGAMLGSTEYSATNGSPGNALFVSQIYEAALGREPDQAGLSAWDTAITNGGMSRAQMAVDIAESPESMTHNANNIEYGFKLA